MGRIVRIGAAALAGVTVIGVASVFALASGFDKKITAADTPFPDITASTDPAVIERGEYLVRTVAHCGQCHAAYDRSGPHANTREVALSGGLLFDMGIVKLWSANLTPDHETGIGRRSDGELARTIRHGVLPDGQISIFMRYSAGKLSDEDLTAVISYLRSQAPVRNDVKPAEVGVIAKALFSLVEWTPNMEAPPKHVPPAAQPSVERGQYLAEHVSLCVGCHSHVDMATMTLKAPKAGGGDPQPSAGGDGEFVPPNLTSHATGMTGKLDESAFVARLRGGRVHTYSIMPWEDVSRATEADLRSIYQYLKTLPPVDNEVGPTFR